MRKNGLLNQLLDTKVAWHKWKLARAFTTAALAFAAIAFARALSGGNGNLATAVRRNRFATVTTRANTQAATQRSLQRLAKSNHQRKRGGSESIHIEEDAGHISIFARNCAEASQFVRQLTTVLHFANGTLHDLRSVDVETSV